MNLLGLTIGCGERFGRMAALAAREFTRRTGVAARVLGEAEQHAAGVARPHHLKFDLFRFAGDVDAVVFFDADLVFLEPFDPASLVGRGAISAAADLADAPWIIDDAWRAGVRPDDYFNSGLLVVHREAAHVLDDARSLLGTLRTPFQDQTHLNAAVRRTGVNCWRLPPTFNVHVDREHTASLDGVIGAHVHWVKDAPAADLERYYGDGLRSLFWRQG